MSLLCLTVAFKISAAVLISSTVFSGQKLSLSMPSMSSSPTAQASITLECLSLELDEHAEPVRGGIACGAQETEPEAAQAARSPLGFVFQPSYGRKPCGMVVFVVYGINPH